MKCPESNFSDWTEISFHFIPPLILFYFLSIVPGNMDSCELREYHQMRRFAFLAVLVSTVAVVASVITLPMMYNYVQNFQSHMMVEAEFCRVGAQSCFPFKLCCFFRVTVYVCVDTVVSLSKLPEPAHTGVSPL